MNPQRRAFLTLSILLLGLVVAIVSWWIWGRTQALPTGLIQANGRIEGDRYTVASKLPGRVETLFAREGDAVQIDQPLAQLDASQVDAQVQQAHAGLLVAQAQLKAQQTELATLRREVPLKIATAQSNVRHAQAALTAARARAEQADRDADRAHSLSTQQTISKAQVEQAELAAKVAKADVQTAVAAVNQANKQLDEAMLGQQQIDAKAALVSAATAQVTQAQAILTQTRSTQADTTIKAPAGGIITERITDVGEVVAAGAPIFDIVDLDRLYLKVYVPEKQIGRLRLALPAQIYTDAFPQQPFAATVRYIASRAEFTPKEVQTPDERVKLVYEVRLYLDANPDHRLTPGLPADAMIRWQDDTPWMPPQW